MPTGPPDHHVVHRPAGRSPRRVRPPLRQGVAPALQNSFARARIWGSGIYLHPFLCRKPPGPRFPESHGAPLCSRWSGHDIGPPADRPGDDLRSIAGNNSPGLPRAPRGSLPAVSPVPVLERTAAPESDRVPVCERHDVSVRQGRTRRVAPLGPRWHGGTEIKPASGHPPAFAGRRPGASSACSSRTSSRAPPPPPTGRSGPCRARGTRPRASSS